MAGKRQKKQQPSVAFMGQDWVVYSNLYVPKKLAERLKQDKIKKD